MTDLSTNSIKLRARMSALAREIASWS